MKFDRLPSPFPELKMFGAVRGAFTFIITEDGDGEFTASAKVDGDDARHDLGGYCAHKTLAAAQSACENFYRNRNS